MFNILCKLLCIFCIFYAYSAKAQQVTASDGSLLQIEQYLRFLAKKDAVISSNIANAATPSYIPIDVQPTSSANLTARTTQKHHIATGDNNNFSVVEAAILELQPNGNGVVIEDELLKKSINAVNMQEATKVYTKTREMIRIAIRGAK